VTATDRGGPGSAAHHYVLRCARDTRASRPSLRTWPLGRVEHQPAAAGKDRRPRSLVSGLLFTTNGTTKTR